jgi:hypothetical protein
LDEAVDVAKGWSVDIAAIVLDSLLPAVTRCKSKRLEAASASVACSFASKPRLRLNILNIASGKLSARSS